MCLLNVSEVMKDVWLNKKGSLAKQIILYHSEIVLPSELPSFILNNSHPFTIDFKK